MNMFKTKIHSSVIRNVTIYLLVCMLSIEKEREKKNNCKSVCMCIYICVNVLK